MFSFTSVFHLREPVIISQQAIPALDNKLITEVNAANGGWKAGRNARFEGATLLDAKKLMGTLQNTQPTALPAREYTPSKGGDLPTDFDWCAALTP